MSSITIQIHLYGAFRKFGALETVTVVSGSTAIQVKKALSETLGTLVNDSVLANEDAILPNSHVFEHDVALSILPPVCGG